MEPTPTTFRVAALKRPSQPLSHDPGTPCRRPEWVSTEGGRMDWKVAAMSITLMLFTGCAATHDVAAPTERVELVSMTSLPTVDLGSYKTGMRFNVLMHILADGSVESVKMLGSSGKSEWDSLAVLSMKQWRYAPFRRDGIPADLWFRQLVVVQIQEPILMTIGELASSSSHEADSLYLLLEKGTDLDSLFRRAIGTFDIVKYPQNVRDKLRRLGAGEHTSPIRRGEVYVIYKRFEVGAM
jgi:TonB family protein